MMGAREWLRHYNVKITRSHNSYHVYKWMSGDGTELSREIFADSYAFAIPESVFSVAEDRDIVTALEVQEAIVLIKAHIPGIELPGDMRTLEGAEMLALSSLSDITNHSSLVFSILNNDVRPFWRGEGIVFQVRVPWIVTNILETKHVSITGRFGAGYLPFHVWEGVLECPYTHKQDIALARP